MSWEVRQTKRFARTYKKLHDNMIGAVDSAIAEVANNPDIGDKKKGDLSELWVHKFRCQGQLICLVIPAKTGSGWCGWRRLVPTRIFIGTRSADWSKEADSGYADRARRVYPK